MGWLLDGIGLIEFDAGARVLELAAIWAINGGEGGRNTVLAAKRDELCEVRLGIKVNDEQVIVHRKGDGAGKLISDGVVEFPSVGENDDAAVFVGGVDPVKGDVG